MRRPASRFFLALACALYFSHTAFAAPDAEFRRVLNKADEAALKGDEKTADFYMARYLGLSARDPSGTHGPEDLGPLLQKRQLPPKAFIPGHWDGDLIDWFEKSLHARWGADGKKVREKARSVEIATRASGGDHFVTVVACPELELWHVLRNGVSERPLVLAAGSASDRPLVFFGKLFKGLSSFRTRSFFLDTQHRSLHYVWRPEFFDVDGDGTPEVWLRYQLTWGNGFSQVLDVYRIQNDNELVLMRRFQSGDEGIARRLADGRVETGTALGATRFERDRYRFETLRYEGEAFRKVAEEERPFFLTGPGWRPYFEESTG